MNSFTEVFSSKEKELLSPDGNIAVTVKGAGVTGVEMSGGAYSRYREADLEVQITALIKLVMVTRKRFRREALAEVLGHEPVKRELSTKDLEYRRQLQDVIGEGHSERISIYAQPNEFWDVEIRPGSLKESTGATFIDECVAVAEAALSDLQRKIRAVNNETYGHTADVGFQKSDITRRR